MREILFRAKHIHVSTSFLCNKKREYQKRCDRAYEQEKQARKFLEDEPDREDLKSRLNYAIKLQDRYSTLIDFIEELQKAPIAYDVDEVIDRLEECATDNRRMALLSGNKEFTYREDEDMEIVEIVKEECCSTADSGNPVGTIPIKRTILNRMKNAVMEIYLNLSEDEIKSLQDEIQSVTETNCDYKIYDIAQMLKDCVDTAVNGI